MSLHEEATTVPHIICEDARHHVLWWDSSGSHCTEPRCKVNHKTGHALIAALRARSGS